MKRAERRPPTDAHPIRSSALANDSDLIEVQVVTQYLGWDLQWHVCDTRHAPAYDDSIFAQTYYLIGCPRTGFTYRALSLHGGVVGSSPVPLNHYPLVSPTLFIH
jgi:hypothetical protein